MRALPRLCELYPGICLTTEEKVQENFIQRRRRVPVGMMKTEHTEQNRTYITIRIHKHNNKNT